MKSMLKLYNLIKEFNNPLRSNDNKEGHIITTEFISKEKLKIMWKMLLNYYIKKLNRMAVNQ